MSGELARPTVRIDAQTTLSLALVLLLVGGGVQYGRQSERLDRVEAQLETVTKTLNELRDVILKTQALATGRPE